MDEPLFPETESDGNVVLGVAMHEDNFLKNLRRRASAAKLPEWLVKRVTLHGFRAGGATDAFRLRGDNPQTVAYIKRQGRWSSDCYEIYIRLRRDNIVDMFDAILREACLTDNERAGGRAEMSRAEKLVREMRENASVCARAG